MILYDHKQIPRFSRVGHITIVGGRITGALIEFILLVRFLARFESTTLEIGARVECVDCEKTVWFGDLQSGILFNAILQ